MDEVAERKATCNIQGNNHRLGYINHPSELVGIVEGVDENGYPVLVQVADTHLTIPTVTVFPIIGKRSTD